MGRLPADRPGLNRKSPVMPFNRMVECSIDLDFVFGSPADPTRRDILRRVSARELSIGEIAKQYTLTFAAVSKHLQILEHAKLVVKRRQGKRQFVRTSPKVLRDASTYLAVSKTVGNAV